MCWSEGNRGKQATDQALLPRLRVWCLLVRRSKRPRVVRHTQLGWWPWRRWAGACCPWGTVNQPSVMIHTLVIECRCRAVMSISMLSAFGLLLQGTHRSSSAHVCVCERNWDGYTGARLDWIVTQSHFLLTETVASNCRWLVSWMDTQLQPAKSAAKP